MKIDVIVLFKVRQVTKYYFCIPQYSSTHPTITNVKQLLKWRNIKHTDQPLTNSRRNAKMLPNVPVHW